MSFGFFIPGKIWIIPKNILLSVYYEYYYNYSEKSTLWSQLVLKITVRTRFIVTSKNHQ